MHIETTETAAKLAKLCQAEGFDSVDDLLNDSIADSVCPAICIAPGCDLVCAMEPDQTAAYCEACGGQTMVSALVLSGLI